MVDSLWYTASSDRTPLKLFLNIDSPDTADDILLDNLGTTVNRIIDNEIFPFKDTIPETSDLTEDLQEYVNLYVASRYKIHGKEFDECRISNTHWYHRKCVCHIAHLVRLDCFF